jgi:hypothetical protein
MSPILMGIFLVACLVLYFSKNTVKLGFHRK